MVAPQHCLSLYQEAGQDRALSRRLSDLSGVITRLGLTTRDSTGASRAECFHSSILAICEYPLSSAEMLGLRIDNLSCRNHASNPYMLYALGITHVVSVGETALIKPPNVDEGDPVPRPNPVMGAQGDGNVTVYSTGPGGHGSLWIEQREGRIKVLDIQGICDDGIDSIEPWLEPVCDWIDKAREEGGRVLVHCRVGVSRSATVVVSMILFVFNERLLTQDHSSTIDCVRHEASWSAARGCLPYRAVTETQIGRAHV